MFSKITDRAHCPSIIVPLFQNVAQCSVVSRRFRPTSSTFGLRSGWVCQLEPFPKTWSLFYFVVMDWGPLFLKAQTTLIFWLFKKSHFLINKRCERVDSLRKFLHILAEYRIGFDSFWRSIRPFFTIFLHHWGVPNCVDCKVMIIFAFHL